VQLIDLRASSSGHDLFLVDPSHDSPPMYITKYSELGPKTYYVDVRRLLAHFENLTAATPTLLNPAEGSLLSGSLKYHLILTFTAPLERSYARHAYNGVIDLSLGLIGTHYQLAEQRPFEEVIETQHIIQTSEYSPTLSGGIGFASSSDYDISYTPQDEQAKAEASREHLDTYRCQIVNISPGGYCVRWSGKTPNVLRTGELVSVREPSDKTWHIGLIRWVKQNPTEGAEFGIEILSPRGKPCGARVLRKDGASSEYMRTLLLPEMKNLNRPATIITPILAFKTGYRISIRLGREEVKAQLTREIMVTQSFSQFEFLILRNEQQPKAPTTTVEKPRTLSIDKEDAYDEVWHTL